MKIFIINIILLLASSDDLPNFGCLIMSVKTANSYSEGVDQLPIYSYGIFPPNYFLKKVIVQHNVQSHISVWKVLKPDNVMIISKLKLLQCKYFILERVNLSMITWYASIQQLTMRPIMTSLGPSCLWIENICRIRKQKVMRFNAKIMRAAEKQSAQSAVGMALKIIPTVNDDIVITSSVFHTSII